MFGVLVGPRRCRSQSGRACVVRGVWWALVGAGCLGGSEATFSTMHCPWCACGSGRFSGVRGAPLSVHSEYRRSLWTVCGRRRSAYLESQALGDRTGQGEEDDARLVAVMAVAWVK